MTLASGEVINAAHYPFKGTPEAPLSDQDLLGKVLECAAYAGIREDRARGAVDFLLALERHTGVRPLFEYLSRVAPTTWNQESALGIFRTSERH